MSTNVVTVSPEMSIREAMELFGKNYVSGAVVSVMCWPAS
jgi:CBS domain-containing protein